MKKRLFAWLLILCLLVGMAPSGLQAFAANESTETIALGEEKEFTLQEDEHRSFTFTPEVSGGYVFYSAWRYRADLYVRDSNGSLLDEVFVYPADANGHGICVQMTAGEVYRLEVYRAKGSYSGNMCVGIVEMVYAESVTLPEIFSVGLGFDAVLTAAVEPSNAWFSMDWQVDDETVVNSSYSADATLYMEGLALGSATVTLTEENSKLTASCQVTVTEAGVLEEGCPTAVSLYYGEEKPFLFTPSTNGVYQVGSEDSGVYIRIYDAAGEEIGNSAANGQYYGTYCEMCAGETYTVVVSVESWGTDELDCINNITICAEPFVQAKDVLLDYYVDSDNDTMVALCGEEVWLDILLLPLNTLELYTIESSDPSVVSVNEWANFILYCEAPGVATITISTNSGDLKTFTIVVCEEGNNITWDMDTKTGTLTVSGTGAMPDYYDYGGFYSEPIPWASWQEEIQKIVIKDGISHIGNGAFNNCPNLVSVTIPESVTSIGANAFGFNSKLAEITIPANVASIGEGAFRFCPSLKGIWVDKENDYYCNDQAGVLYNRDKTTLHTAPPTLSGSYRIADGVVRIADWAFWGCSGMTGITLSSDLRHIGERSFQQCKGLIGIALPDSLLTIRDSAFIFCDGLTSITIPKDICIISGYAFYRCKNLNKIGFDGNAPKIEEDAFASIAATAYYPAGNPSWTPGVMQNYGGTITWASYEPGTMPFSPFWDVPTDKYYHDPVLWAYSNGITAGATATTFNPDGNCTRAQVVTFLWRAAGCPEPTTTNNPFTDVESDHYFYKAVLWAVETGVTAGTTATTFNPKGNCNRAQVVTFMYRAVGSPTVAGTDNPFADVPADKYYHDAVLWAVENGITSGISATKFAPNNTCTRAQIVTFLYRGYAE